MPSACLVCWTTRTPIFSQKYRVCCPVPWLQSETAVSSGTDRQNQAKACWPGCSRPQAPARGWHWWELSFSEKGMKEALKWKIHRICWWEYPRDSSRDHCLWSGNVLAVLQHHRFFYRGEDMWETRAFAGMSVGSIHEYLIYLNGGCNGMSIILQNYGRKKIMKNSKRKGFLSLSAGGACHSLVFASLLVLYRCSAPDPTPLEVEPLCCGISSDHFYRTSCHLSL